MNTMTSMHFIIIYLLAAIFALSGILKISQPKPKLLQIFPWTKDFKTATIKFIGFCEFSASLGLGGPNIIGFGHKLTSWAALGICIIMVLAGIYNSRKRAYFALAINIAFAFAALSIALGL